MALRHLYPGDPGFKEPFGGCSEAAAEAIRPRAAALRDEVLRCFRRHGAMTADECAERLGRSILSIRPRVTELAAAGRIEKTGERRRNASGQSASVWRPVY